MILKQLPFKNGDTQLQKANLYADIMTIVMLLLGVYIFAFLNVIVGFLVVLISGLAYYSRKRLGNSGSPK